MDDELFGAVYRMLLVLNPRRGKRQQYRDSLIVGLYFWSVIRERPMSWACDRRNVPAVLNDRPLPSVSQFSRRLRSEAADQLIDQLEQLVLAVPAIAALGCFMIDAKPLEVSPYSKDKQARRGWAYNRKGRGYKLFLLSDERKRIISWRVDSMNVAEPTKARELIPHMDQSGYLLGDKAYDSNALYVQAAEQDVQLVAPRKRPNCGVAKRASSPPRLHAIAMLEPIRDNFGHKLYAARTDIERLFSTLAASPIGLDKLPPHVRTLRRVRRWVKAKLILFGVHRGDSKTRTYSR